jgi:hypothetical protein
MFVVVTTVLIAWGALAFGAVYPWALLPLIAIVVVTAAWQRPSLRGDRLIVAAFTLLIGAMALQLVPWTAAGLARVSPATAQFLALFNVGFANGMSGHALSIVPSLTMRTLGFVALWALWIATCSAAIARGASLRVLARNMMGIGTFVALIGLAQLATFNGKLLWFWTPDYFATNGFGPFVNRNHFAGWMMLMVSIGLGLTVGYASRAGALRRPTFRDRVIWLASPAGYRVFVAAAAVLVMLCAVIWTMSRSGIVATGCALTVFVLGAAWRSRGRVQRGLVVAYGMCLIAGVVAWRGADTLVTWYGNTATWQWRVQLWKDTLPALRRFWVAGSGLNTYQQLMLVFPRTNMATDPVQAHNDYLQLAVEGGLLVGVPVLLLLLALARRVVVVLRAPQEELHWWVRMGAVAGLCGMAVQEISEFSLQVPGVALLFATTLALAVHTPVTARASRRASGDQFSQERPGVAA